MKNINTLTKQLNPKNTKINELMANHTYLKIGGPADVFYEARDTNDMINVIKLARLQNIPVTILGRGSNVLVSDDGIRGLVIKNMTNTIKISGQKPVQESKITVKPRWEADSKSGSFKYEFRDLDYDETNEPRVEVTLDSGVDLPFAINYLIEKSITGLQWYAGIPGTIGGAVFNNIHGGTHFLSEVLSEVKVINEELKIKDIKINDLKLDYDKSRFHDSGEIILQATLNLYRGDAQKAKQVAIEWAKRKSIQPKNSAGCTFANISDKQKEKLNLPTTSAGYIIEHELEMSGYRVGDAAISDKHKNFIVNAGNATAKDYVAVMKEIQKRAKDRLGIELVPEIVLLGFDR